MSKHVLPDLVPESKIKLPRQAARTLASGLTVIAIRRLDRIEIAGETA